MPDPGLASSFLVFLAFLYFRLFERTKADTRRAFLAIVVSGCPPCVVVRRASTFDVDTLETTFATRFLLNFVRMFVVTISRPSLNMGHIGSKTRSPGQILGNSCLHSRGHIRDPILMELGQNVCFDTI